MANHEFIFNVNTLVGCRISIVNALEEQFRVEEKYRTKYSESKRLSRIITALSYLDRLRYRALARDTEIKKAPVYILGHWRSGTTLLHNMLCSFKDTAYPTTYQTVFPNNLFFFQGFIKRIMQYYLPDRRLVDRVRMHVDFPQEEDFALGSEAGFSIYYWFYFPKDRQWFADHYFTLSSNRNMLNKPCDQAYLRFIKRCMLNTGGTQYIAKNPPSMARIPFLLRLFPESRFVYIERDPYEVLESTFLFFKGFLKTLQLQDIDDQELWDFIYSNYCFLQNKYQEEKYLISPDRMKEIKYEQLIRDPQKIFKELHRSLFQDLQTDEAKLSAILDNHQKHTFKNYRFSNSYIERVNSELGDLIERSGYPRR
jgi:hypothetical protein